MGKTAAGAVWLDADMLSPYDYWQFWRNTEDADVGAIPQAVHAAADGRDRAAGGAAGRRDQRGEEDAGDRGDRAAARPRGGGGGGGDSARKPSRKARWRESLPSVEIPHAEFEAGLGALTAFVRAGLVASTGEARRQIKGGGLRVNDEVLGDEKSVIGAASMRDGVVKLSLGRKKHVLLRGV